MVNTDTAAAMTTADLQELQAVGDAIFAEWYPNHRPGDPIPAMPPLRVMRESQELAAEHERCRRLGIGIYARVRGRNDLGARSTCETNKPRDFLESVPNGVAPFDSRSGFEQGASMFSIAHLPTSDLFDRLTALDYERAAGPEWGTLGDWRARIANDDQHANDFIERVCALADDLSAQLTEQQRSDALGFSVNHLIGVLENEV